MKKEYLYLFNLTLKQANKDREKIEQRRLQDRVGGFQKYTDKADIYHPDPSSTHFFNEAERFDKDFAVLDKKKREDEWQVKHSKVDNLRQERL